VVATCDDLRLGGTLSAAGITGGTSINSTALSVADWSRILGSAGISGGIQVVNGRAGGFVAGDLLGRERHPMLRMRLTDIDPVGGLTEPTRGEQLQANTDMFLALVTNPDGQYLEIDMPDGSQRFLFVYNFDASAIRQPRRQRTISVPLISAFPYWKAGGQEATQAISGADLMAFAGNREVHDAVLVFSGDGTFTHSDLGWSIEVTGSAAAVTVDLGARTVIESGADALNRIRRTPATGKGGVWGWFTPGSNNVTSDVSVGVTWRPSYA
jgi:hypothetical protein